jgi:hypothetical protein
MDKLAALEARVAELGVELVAKPQPAPRTAPARLAVDYAALKQERDDLAERLNRIVAYDPKIEAKAKAWIAQVDQAPQVAERHAKPGGRKPRHQIPKPAKSIR